MEKTAQTTSVQTVSSKSKDTNNLKPLQEIQPLATDENNLLSLLDNCRIDITQNYIPPEPILTMQGAFEDSNVTVFSRGDISAVTGKAKSRKTFFNVLIAKYILEDDKNTVLYIDTEQAQHHTFKIEQRIYRLMDWEENLNNDRLNVYSLRELNTEQRFLSIEKLIIKHNPTFVFLDGIRDVMFDFNDNKESIKIIDTLMRLSSKYQTHICNVLHENKGQNTEMRGHLGTELQNKSETVISITKSGETSTVEPRYCRNSDFKKFSFEVKNGLPVECEMRINNKSDENLRNLFNELLPKGKTLSYTELVKCIRDKKGIGESAAKKNITNALEKGFINKNQINHYYSVDNNENEEDENLPF